MDLVSVEVVSSNLRPVLVRRTHLPLPVGIEGSARHAHKRHAAQTVAGELARYTKTPARRRSDATKKPTTNCPVGFLEGSHRGAFREVSFVKIVYIKPYRTCIKHVSNRIKPVSNRIKLYQTVSAELRERVGTASAGAYAVNAGH